jgi:hypothetical protein
MTRRALSLSVLVASIACLPACDETMYVNPAPVLDSSDAAAHDAGDLKPEASTDAFPSVDAGPVRRTVMNRSPFGNLSFTDNLLLDGDMEMSTGAGQTPWIGIGILGQASLNVETGGRCRSGLRCLALDAGLDTLLGYGVAAGDKPLEFWLWAKVPGNDCSVVTVHLFPRMRMNIGMFNQVTSETPEPDGEGWCRFHAVRSPMDEAVGVLVEARLLDRQRVIVDDAVLRVADGTSPTSLRSLPITKSEHARIVAKIAPVLEKRWFGPLPNPGHGP